MSINVKQVPRKQQPTT